MQSHLKELSSLTIYFILFILLIFSCEEQNRDVEFYQAEALKYLSSNNYSKALVSVSNAIQKDSFDENSYILKGRIENLMEDYQTALADFTIALSINKKNTAGLYNKGVSFYYLEKYDSAILYLNFAITTKGTDSVYIEYNNTDFSTFASSDVSMAEVKYYRALTYYYSGKLDFALDDFRFCEADGFNLKDVYLYIGNINLKYHQNNIACEYLQKANSLGNSDAKTFIEKYCRY